MEFSRPKYWIGQPFPFPGYLPNPWIKPWSPTLQADSLPAEPYRTPKNTGVGSLSLFQGIFQNPGIEPGSPACWHYSLQASVTWAAATSLRPEQAWVPWLACLGAEGRGKDVSQWTLLHGPGVSASLCTSPPDPGGSSCRLHLLYPKDVEPLGWKSFGKFPGLHVSGWWGSHIQLPSLGSAHLWWKHPPQSGVAGIPGHRGKEGRRNETQALGVSSSSFHSK